MQANKATPARLSALPFARGEGFSRQAVIYATVDEDRGLFDHEARDPVERARLLLEVEMLQSEIDDCTRQLRALRRPKAPRPSAWRQIVERAQAAFWRLRGFGLYA